jgi:hypothetical protein
LGVKVLQGSLHVVSSAAAPFPPYTTMGSRRSQQTSDESASCRIPSTLRADVDLTNRLSALLDIRRNEEMEFQLQL